MIALLLLLAAYSGPNTSLKDWYEGLKQPGSGTSCCSEADCKMLPSEQRDAGYFVFIDGEWIAVPKEKVLRIKNLAGAPVTCHIGTTIYCFVPGLET